MCCQLRQSGLLHGSKRVLKPDVHATTRFSHPPSVSETSLENGTRPRTVKRVAQSALVGAPLCQGHITYPHMMYMYMDQSFGVVIMLVIVFSCYSHCIMIICIVSRFHTCM